MSDAPVTPPLLDVAFAHSLFFPIPMLPENTTEPASQGTDQVSMNEGQGSPETTPQSTKPWLCRPPVRLTLYAFLVLFLAGTLAWGIIPRIMDPTYEQHIQTKEVMVGMTRQQVLQAWGGPYQTNVTHTHEGLRREEWIYEDWISTAEVRHRYLYFEEGILVGGQR